MPRRSPTLEIFQTLQALFDHFNKELFDGQLEECMIIPQRKANTKGYFKPRNWGDGGEQRRHEIAMNPAYFLIRPWRDTASTMAHEMVHQLRYQQGEKSKGYHSKEWAAFMQRIGMMPSTTGAPGGKTTGYRVDHYIIDGGPFDVSFHRFKQTIGWGDVPVQGREQAKPKRLKFVCPECNDNSMGKASLDMLCKRCRRTMLHSEQPPVDDSEWQRLINFPAGVATLVEAYGLATKEERTEFFTTMLGCTPDELTQAFDVLKTGQKPTAAVGVHTQQQPPSKRGRGRSPSSNNRPKLVEVSEAIAKRSDTSNISEALLDRDFDIDEATMLEIVERALSLPKLNRKKLKAALFKSLQYSHSDARSAINAVIDDMGDLLSLPPSPATVAFVNDCIAKLDAEECIAQNNDSDVAIESAPVVIKRRGRPPGAKNRPKPIRKAA